MASSGDKAPGAFRTIGELSAELGVAQHILRYWETKFPQLRPLQRAGNRRYYRPGDVELARTIHRLLTKEGYTMRGAQMALRNGGAEPAASPETAAPEPPAEAPLGLDHAVVTAADLRGVRNRLAAALDD